DLEIVYLLAGCEARRAQLRPLVGEALARADQDRLARELAERRVLALIGSRAVAAAPEAASADFRVAVDSALAEGRARSLAVETTTASVVGALTDAGIRTLALKGPLLAAAAHGDPGVRATSDIDLLVEP